MVKFSNPYMSYKLKKEIQNLLYVNFEQSGKLHLIQCDEYFLIKMLKHYSPLGLFNIREQLLFLKNIE